MAACAVLPALHAQDAPPVNADELLQSLEKLRSTQESTLQTSFSRIIQTFRQGASSPTAAWELYQEAVKATRFTGLTRDNSQFRDWKKREEDKLDDPNFRKAIQVHLLYLAISLQHAGGAELKDTVAALAQYASSYPRIEMDSRNREMAALLNEPITSGVFVRRNGLELYLTRLKDWEMVPSNVDGMFEKVVLPYWREQKDPKAVAYWEERINREAERVKGADLVFPREHFENVRRPVLLWNRAQEMVKVGMPNRAAVEMYNVLKNYPSHPNFSSWADELKNLLKPAPSENAASTAAATGS
jgi:predicted Zn-dependent protease